MVAVVLNMIVRNESAIIKRCLDSLDWVDAFVIVDTGSTDDTMAIISEWADQTGKPGHIFQEEWQDFGQNRTQAIHHAKTWLLQQDQFKELPKIYLLFLDADMCFEGGRHLIKKLEEADVWDIPQETRFLKFLNTRLVRASLDVKVVGTTHEYYHILTPDIVRKKNTQVCIQDIGDGGSKSDKTLRDIRLLTKGLENEPTNPRYWFYLANSLKDARRFSEAREAYDNRIRCKGWYEEVYCSFLYKGDCCMETNDREMGVIEWMNAYNTDPDRPEAICRLVSFFRRESKHNLAMMFIEKGLEVVKKESPRMLFLEKPCYEFLLDYELSICAYYVGKRQEGKQACEKLLEKSDKLPFLIRESCRKNYLFYTNNGNSGKDW